MLDVHLVNDFGPLASNKFCFLNYDEGLDDARERSSLAIIKRWIWAVPS
jgi:hypothetical protein